MHRTAMPWLERIAEQRNAPHGRAPQCSGLARSGWINNQLKEFR